MKPALTGLACVAAISAAGALYFAIGSRWTEEERALIASMSLSNLLPLQADPSNRVADLPAAAALGEVLFFDLRMSADGKTGCVTCHDPAQEFQDGLSHDVGDGIGIRRTMPIRGSAYTPWLLWDGRADSLWAQALGPVENPLEHGSDRVSAVRLIAGHYAEPYTAIFGEIPDMSDLPKRASPLLAGSPGDDWATLSEAIQNDLNRTFANIGKSIAAFERTLGPERSRFDDYADALASGNNEDDILSEQELDGLAVFIGEGRCTSCHTGPRFTDDAFHNTGIPFVDDRATDEGRSAALPTARADPFNCVGPYSDAGADDCLELRFARASHDMIRAFRTPTLRAVAQRPPYMHAGQIATLEGVIMHYLRAPAAPAGHSELERLTISPEDVASLAAFLRTLDPA